MKKFTMFFILFLICMLQYTKLNSQTKTIEKSTKSIGIMVGRGYEDGWVNLTKLPTISIVYTHSLHKRFAIRGQVSSFYRSMPDSYLYGDGNGRILANIVVRDSNSPFFEDVDQINNVGIKDLDPSFTIKTLSVPLDVGIFFYPLNFRKHYLGVFIGPSLTYESYNWWREYYPADIILGDGSVYKSSFVALNTEFRGLTVGDCVKIEYSYQFERMKLSIGASENNLLWSHRSSIIFYNISIGIHAKI